MSGSARRGRWTAALLAAATGVVVAATLELASRSGGSSIARHAVIGAGAAAIAGLLWIELALPLRRLSSALEALRVRLRTIDARTRHMHAASSAWSFYESALAGRPLYLTDYSLEPESGLWLLEAITRKRPVTLLEFGSGASTLAAAASFRRLGSGRIIAIEEDAGWKERVEVLVRLNGLSDYAEIHHCPLGPATSATDIPWYSMDGVSIPETIDLVLVDGPAGGRHPTIRQPALPFVWDRLAVGGELLLDDGAREGEQAIVKAWQERFGDRISAEFRTTPRGAWVIRKKTA